MKPLLLPTLAVSVTSVAACAVAAFYLSSALIPYVLAFAGFVEAMCFLVARRKADEGLVWLRVNYGLVLMSTGFLIGRSFEYLLAGSLGASLVFAAFAVCTLVGLAIGDWIRGRLRREVLLVAIGVISILHGFDSSGRSGIANSCVGPAVPAAELGDYIPDLWRPYPSRCIHVLPEGSPTVSSMCEKSSARDASFQHAQCRE